MVGNLQGYEPYILVLKYIEDNRTGDRMEQVARRQIAAGVEQHLERIGHVQQAQTPGGVQSHNACQAYPYTLPAANRGAAS